MRRLPLALLALSALAACHTSVNIGTPANDGSAPPALGAIVPAELRRDLFTLASDSMRGREAGTTDELRAAAWTAERAREAGLRPAGDDGTYFQFWPMRRVRTTDASRIRLVANGDTSAYRMGREFVVMQPTERELDLPLVWVGEGKESDVANLDLKGKAVAALLTAPSPATATAVSLGSYRYASAAIRQRAQYLTSRGAAAVVLVSDAVAEDGWAFGGATTARGRYSIADTSEPRIATTTAPVLWVRRAALDRVRAATRLTASLHSESFVYPSVNVVAVAPGRDAALRSEYVLFSGHSDHDGVRGAMAGDSIWNGADDNASVSVALLAAGRAFVRAPGRRSVLFVWHGAEERGLLGSRWYAAHPTVPLRAIVAVLNGDMIGRNNPDSAALLGSQPPHRNSTDLVDMALEANRRLTRFVIDSSWDRPTHPEGWYFRSDHLSYARVGIPSIFFTTLLHPDYHTPRDDASRIDIAKLARMTQWMYATGWMVAERTARPGVDANFKLER